MTILPLMAKALSEFLPSDILLCNPLTLQNL